MAHTRSFKAGAIAARAKLRGGEIKGVYYRVTPPGRKITSDSIHPISDFWLITTGNPAIGLDSFKVCDSVDDARRYLQNLR